MPEYVDEPQQTESGSHTRTPSPDHQVQQRHDKSVRDDRVTARAFLLGIIFAAALAALNCWIETLANVHFLGGVQMPFGAVFVLLFFILAVNLPLRVLHRAVPVTASLFPPFSAVELLTVYSMLLFAALISTPGADNFFLTVGPTLFYFSSRENGWANLFYQHIPSWFAPSWNGRNFDPAVINPLYFGGLEWAQIPWHAWTAMLIAWSVFLLLIYATLFFLSLLLRRQWIEHEALAFPLVQVPLQMVEVDAPGQRPPGRVFWANGTMWAGFTLAAALHLLRGLNNYYPDWPVLVGFQGQILYFNFTERPWSAMGGLSAELFLGSLGVAFLLTREVAFSFWVMFLFINYQLVLAEQFGFPPATLPKDTYSGRPAFIAFQSVGAWTMMAALLLWTARRHLAKTAREAVGANRTQPGEPFAPRFVIIGFCLSFAGLLAWSWFAGINVFFALAFFGIYLMASLVLARLVIEGGFLFPQLTFSPLDWMTTAAFGTAAMGAATVTKLSFIQPMLMSDMRTNVLPGFLHTLKIAHSLKLDRATTRRLMGSAAAAIVVALAVTSLTTIWTLYSAGGLTAYSFFAWEGGQRVFNSASATINSEPGVNLANLFWMAVGATLTLLMMIMRSRFLWFPLHPLGYIMAASYPITRLWLSFLLGWMLKTVLLKFGGNDSVQRVRPFMIGLILGNLSAMVMWMLFGLWRGSQIPYWPA